MLFSRRRQIRLLASALLLPAALGAQTLSAPPAPPARDETITLSPFVVSTDRDVGFVAASSLAGGRLALDLRDTPVAYSVITSEFIQALSLTDLEGAADWVAGTAVTADNGQQKIFGAPYQYTTRGAVSNLSRPQRNFFPQHNNGDAYNLERYDFGRGPNAILFGNGTLGGVSSATTKRAETRKPFHSFQYSLGSWSNHRMMIDVNQPLTDKVALRTAAVWQRSDTWRVAEYDNRQGVFLTTTVKPWRDAELRIEGEHISYDRNFGMTGIREIFTGWDGKTTYTSWLPATPANANQVGISRRGLSYVVDPTNPTGGIFNYQNDPITVAGGANAVVPIAGFVLGSLPAWNIQGGTLRYALNVPERRFDNAIAGSKFRVPSDSFTIAQSDPANAQRFRDLQLTFNQRLGNFYFEAAADFNRSNFTINAEQNRGTLDTYIDINQNLPNGKPNPYFLEPYGQGQLMRTRAMLDYDNLRAALAYVQNTRFGNFTVNAMGGTNRRSDAWDSRYMSMATGADHRQWGFLSAPLAQNIFVRRYWSATDRSIPQIEGRTLPYFNPITNTTTDVTPRWIPDISRRDTQRVDTYDFDYALASLNAKFFHNRLVVLGAFRYDSFNFLSRQQLDKGDYPLDWDGNTRKVRPDAPADFFGLTYRQRDAQGNPIGAAREALTRPRIGANGDRDPLYANDRFKDDFNSPAVTGSKVTRSLGSVLHINDWINPSINFAETFNPPLGIMLLDGTLAQPTVAQGTDFGWRMELFNKRLFVNATYFMNEEENGLSPDGGPSQINTIYDANPIGDTSTVGRNIRGAGSLPLVYRDYQTMESKGFELEVVANLMRGLRLTANYSMPRVYQSNLNPTIAAYLDKNKELFKQIVNDAGVRIDASDNAAVDLTVPIDMRSPDAATAAAAYNALVLFRKNIIQAKRLYVDQKILNLFGDYTLQSGRARGLRLGAGVRYRSRGILGFRGGDTIVNPANPLQGIDDPAVDAYSPVYTPQATYNVTGTLAYAWKFKQGRELQANLVINNLLNDRGPIYSSITGAGALRPKNSNFTSPARETVPVPFGLTQPISYNLSLTWKL